MTQQAFILALIVLGVRELKDFIVTVIAAWKGSAAQDLELASKLAAQVTALESRVKTMETRSLEMSNRV